ncbi:MAG: PKD domain-containing protein [Candidatus Bipolaricaulota bacterium]
MNGRRFRQTILAGLGVMAGLAVLSGCSLLPHPAARVSLQATPVEGTAPLEVCLEVLVAPDPDLVVRCEWLIDGVAWPLDNRLVRTTFHEPGTHRISVTAYVSDGVAAVADTEVVVINTPPIASLRLSNDAPLVGEWVVADASGSWDADENLASFEWRFGDGTVATGVVTGHAYTTEGAFTVSLTAIDAAGARATAEHRVIVHAGSPGGGCSGGGGVSLR